MGKLRTTWAKKKDAKEEEEEVWNVWEPDPEVMLREPVEMGHKMIHSVIKALNDAWDAQKNAQGEVDFDAKGTRGGVRSYLARYCWSQFWFGRNISVESFPLLQQAPDSLPHRQDCVVQQKCKGGGLSTMSSDMAVPINWAVAEVNMYTGHAPRKW